MFSKDHARSRLTPFCAKRTVSSYLRQFCGRPFELKKKKKEDGKSAVWTISG